MRLLGHLYDYDIDKKDQMTQLQDILDQYETNQSSGTFDMESHMQAVCFKFKHLNKIKHKFSIFQSISSAQIVTIYWLTAHGQDLRPNVMHFLNNVNHLMDFVAFLIMYTPLMAQHISECFE